MPIIWPYYNPREFHSADVAAMAQLEDARQMDEKIRMAQEEQRQKMEAEATRQAGIMKYQQLRASGVAPEAAWSATAGAITTGGGLSDFATGTHYLGTNPVVKVPEASEFTLGNTRYERLPGQPPTVIATATESAQKPDPLLIKDYEHLQSKIARLESELSKPMTGSSNKSATKKYNSMMDQREMELEDAQEQLKLLGERIRGGSSGTVAPVFGAGPENPEAGSEMYNAGMPGPAPFIPPPTSPTPRTIVAENKVLTREQAQAFYNAAGKDKVKARQMAREAGFTVD